MQYISRFPFYFFLLALSVMFIFNDLSYLQLLLTYLVSCSLYISRAFRLNPNKVMQYYQSLLYIPASIIVPVKCIFSIINFISISQMTFQFRHLDLLNILLSYLSLTFSYFLSSSLNHCVLVALSLHLG